MDKKEYAKIVSKNLNIIAYNHDKKQSDIAKDLNINKATVSTWFTGVRTPPIDQIDRLCAYFNCLRENIMEPGGALKNPPKISAFETNLLEAYRRANPGIKESVQILLGLKEGE